MSVRIDIDQASLKHVQNQINLLQQNGGRSFYEAVVKVAFKIKSEAQLRLTGRGHIISSRLKNSIYVKTQKPTLRPDNQLTYSDNKGKSYKSDLGTVNVNANEVAVGTNVEYAAAIELGARPHVIEAKNKKVLSNGKQIFGKRVNHPGFKGDSYLYWAMKNVNVLQSVAKDMTDYIKFGKFLKGTNTKTGSALTNDL
jgi:hypothetical protein